MITLEVKKETDDDWNNNLLSKYGTIIQTKQFGKLGIDFFNAKPLFLKFITDNGKLVGQLLIFESFRGRRKLTEKLGRNFLSSTFSKLGSLLPISYFWSYGPVILDQSYEQQISQSLGEYLYSKKAKFRGSCHPFNSTFTLPSKSNLKRERMSTFVIDLNQDVNTIFSNTDKKSVQKNIKRAEERGVTIKEIKSDEDLNSYYDLQKKFRKENKLVPYSKKDICTGFEVLKNSGYVGLLALYENSPIGAISFSTFNGYVNEFGIARSKIDSEKKLYSQELLDEKFHQYFLLHSSFSHNLKYLFLENQFGL